MLFPLLQAAKCIKPFSCRRKLTETSLSKKNKIRKIKEKQRQFISSYNWTIQRSHRFQAQLNLEDQTLSSELQQFFSLGFTPYSIGFIFRQPSTHEAKTSTSSSRSHPSFKSNRKRASSSRWCQQMELSLTGPDQRNLVMSAPAANHRPEGYGVLIGQSWSCDHHQTKGTRIATPQELRVDSGGVTPPKVKLGGVIRSGDESQTGMSITPRIFPAMDSFPLALQYPSVFPPTLTCSAFVSGTFPSSHSILICSFLLKWISRPRLPLPYSTTVGYNEIVSLYSENLNHTHQHSALQLLNERMRKRCA